MSAPLVRAATAGSLALALAFALPAAAFAESDEERGKSSSAQQQSEDRGRSGDAGKTSGQGQGAKEGSGSQQGKAQKDKARKDKAQKDRSGTSGSSGTRSEGRANGGDPRGNNGTVKIDGEAFDDGRGNEPHVGCVFQVDFYGFDAGDTASITFTGHAPTGGGLLHSQSGTVISNDAAGGGQDRDATLTFSVQNQLSELLSIAPHPQQGWHVKLAVDVDSAPGGAKQKVFWIDCPQPATTGGTTVNPATGGGGTGTEAQTSAQGAGTSTVLPATVVTGTTVAAAERAEMTFGSGTTTLAASGATRAVSGAAAGAAVGEAAAGAATAGSGRMVAQGSTLPVSLPFTGSQALLYLLGLGLTTVAVGAIAHRMGRQQADLG